MAVIVLFSYSDRHMLHIAIQMAFNVVLNIPYEETGIQFSF